MISVNLLTRKVLTAVLMLLVISILTACPNTQQVTPKQTVEETYTYHKIKYSGETVAVISAWYTKSAKNWPEIVDANPRLIPRKLRIGDVVKIPQRLVRRTGSMPADFVTSFKSGVNKDSSKSNQDTQVDASDFKIENDINSEKPSQVESQPDYGNVNKPSVEDAVNQENEVSPSVEESSDFKQNAEPETAPPETMPEVKKETESVPANDENQKIRDQLMQELLQ